MGFNSLDQQPSEVKRKTSSGMVRINPWLIKPESRPDAELKLFCFAYAGGNANVFRQWPTILDPRIELNAVQLPGRAARFKEPLLDSMGAILEALESALSLELENNRYAFFGHSMGASIAFELTRRLQLKHKNLPTRLIVSGRRAPSLASNKSRKPIHDLPREEFIGQLKKLNGTPEVLLEHEDLMDLMEPILRSDFKVIETWQYHESEPLRVPISIFSGIDDEHVNVEALDAWERETVQTCEKQIFPGDHFYLQKYEAELVNKINESLLA